MVHLLEEAKCLEQAVASMTPHVEVGCLLPGIGPLLTKMFPPKEYTLQEIRDVLLEYGAETPASEFVTMQFTFGQSPYRTFRRFREVDGCYRLLEDFDSPPDSDL